MNKITLFIERILNDFASMQKIAPPLFDGQGRCKITLGDVPILIEAPEENQTVLLLSIVYEGNPTPKMFEEALAGNLYWLETKGATLMWDKHSNCLVLCYERPVEGLDTKIFINILVNFSETVRAWHQRFKEVEQAVKT